MVSYYNHPFTMYQKSSNFTTYPSAATWYPSNYHSPNGTQLFPNGETASQQVYYSHMLHQPDWIPHESHASATQSGYLQTPLGIMNSHHHNVHDSATEVFQNIPSPAITVSGSEMSSPCIPAASASPQTPNRPTTSKSPYEWMKKTSYQSQPNPGKCGINRQYK